MGRRHHRARDRQQHGDLPRSHPGSLLAIHRGALSAINDRHQTLRALEMALKRRTPEAGLPHQSGQGCTYDSEDYRTRLDQAGITCSMSRRGNCYDNAVMESWFSTEQSEGANASKATRTRRRPCSTTSRCSIASDVATPRSARSVQRSSSDEQLTRHSQLLTGDQPCPRRVCYCAVIRGRPRQSASCARGRAVRVS